MRIYLSIFCMIFACVLSAQSRVAGKVTLAADKEAAIGATIQVKGTNIGAVTDIEGNYSVNVPNAQAILVFSYTGFATQEIEVGNQTTINVALSESASQLDEVVVTGYGAQKKIRH